MIVQASNHTDSCYRVAKCTKIVFERGKMVKGEGLQVLSERMKTINPVKNEIYKFLRAEQDHGNQNLLPQRGESEKLKKEVELRCRGRHS